MDKFLIKNTTKEQREQIVRESLGCGSGCEFCSACAGLGAGNVFDMYQPYIDGEKEIAEITREFTAPFVR